MDFHTFSFCKINNMQNAYSSLLCNNSKVIDDVIIWKYYQRHKLSASKKERCMQTRCAAINWSSNISQTIISVVCETKQLLSEMKVVVLSNMTTNSNLFLFVQYLQTTSCDWINAFCMDIFMVMKIFTYHHWNELGWNCK